MRSWSCLNELNLLTDSRKHIFFQSVELIKAAPGATLDQAHKDAANTLEVKFTITVEYQHLYRQQARLSAAWNNELLICGRVGLYGSTMRLI